MIHYYVDASVWVKRHVREAGTSWAEGLFHQQIPFGCATLGVIEALSALSRRRAAELLTQGSYERLSAAVRADADRFVLIDLSPEVLARAIELTQVYSLRAADTVHLASATIWRDSLAGDDEVAIVTSDAELAEVAGHAHFPVLIPEREEKKR